MNGRIERIDARYALNSEDNYANVDFFFAEEERRRKWRKRIEGALGFAFLFGWLWLVIWKAAQGIR
jgi:hypothetical protein